MKYIRKEQAKLRVDTYVELGRNRKIFELDESSFYLLPFVGSPRNMLQNYQDAMATVRKYGKPDLFITFTCNPAWPEIVNTIHPWETANNRPDIVVRVFHAKSKNITASSHCQNIWKCQSVSLHRRIPKTKPSSHLFTANVRR